MSEIKEDTDEYHLHIRKGGRVPKTWMLLDSCSTVNIFSNPDLLTNIHKVEKKMRLHCQSGSSSTNLMGTYPGYPEPVWYPPSGIANVLLLENVSNCYKGEYDGDEKSLTVYTKEKTDKYTESK